MLLGRPMRSDRLGETLLPKKLALPVFCSNPLSSVAYATEQIVLVLGLGGLALLALTPWLAAAVVALLIIVVASYRQTCFAYPNGGGAIGMPAQRAVGFCRKRSEHWFLAAAVAAASCDLKPPGSGRGQRCSGTSGARAVYFVVITIRPNSTAASTPANPRAPRMP